MVLIAASPTHAEATAMPHWWGPIGPSPSTVNCCCCSIAKPASLMNGNGFLHRRQAIPTYALVQSAAFVLLSWTPTL